MNQLTYINNDERDIEQLISQSYQPSENQIFYSDLITIEDDIDPNHVSSDKTDDDVNVEKYLTNLSLFYSKTDQPNTIVFSRYSFLPARPEKDFILKKCFFTSTFRGKHTQIDKAYLPTNRVVEMRAERINKKWQVRIIRMGFFQPGEGNEAVSQKPTSTTASTMETAKISVPANLSISGAEIAYKQSDTGIEIKLKISREWAEVIQSGSVDIPTGLYKRQGKLQTYLLVKGDQLDEQNKIELQNNSNRLVFYQGLNYSGYDRVNQIASTIRPRPTSTTALAAVPTPNPTIPLSETTAIASRTKPTEPQLIPKTTNTRSPTQPASASAQVAKTDTKTEPKFDTPTAVPPASTSTSSSPTTASLPTTSSPESVTTDAAPAVAKEQVKPTKPIVAVPPPTTLETSGLTKAMAAQKARYRRAGWLQIVTGIAGLVGGYMAYSAIKKDYDAYKARVDQLNTGYNAWSDLSRNPTGAPLEPMSITGYGKPGVYGAYVGGAVSLGLVINSIRSFTKAGKIKPVKK
ncbi:hypothetical protein GCM10027592_45590 [Spirosoma flavus]